MWHYLWLLPFYLSFKACVEFAPAQDVLEYILQALVVGAMFFSLSQFVRLTARDEMKRQGVVPK